MAPVAAKPASVTLPDAAAPATAPPARPSEADGTSPERAPQVVRKQAPAIKKTPPTRRLRPGDLICGQCGEGNPPSRKFCSRCGHSLLEAEPVKTPWWRKLKVSRGPRVVVTEPGPDADGPGGGSGSGKPSLHRPAGLRPPGGPDAKHALRKVYRRTRVVLGVLVLLGIAFYGAYPPFRSLVNGKVSSVKGSVTKHIDQTYTPAHAVSWTANLHERGHPGYLAIDGYSNTYWLAPFNGSDSPTLTLRFTHPVTLKKMILYSGASGHYLAHGRPSLLVLLFSNQESFTITPQDTPKQQTFSINNALEVKSVSIAINQTYPGNDPKPDAAISDIELFGIGL